MIARIDGLSPAGVAGVKKMGATTGDGHSFADMLQTASQTALDTMREGEALSMKGVAGEASLHEVVYAVNNADATLQTVVAIRDKLVSAYKEILRMPI